MFRALAPIAVALAGASLGSAIGHHELRQTSPLHVGAVLELAGQTSFPPLTLFPPDTGPRFGGLSGLAPTAVPNEFLAVSDDRAGNRVYRIRVTGEGASFRVDLLETMALETGGAAPNLDPEGIVVTAAGDVLISSEGRASLEPPVPPAIAQYSRSGAFVRLLPIRAHLTPAERGQAARGVRANAGFESLTLTPSGRRLYAATETALIQDGDPVSFERGTTARILEYVTDGSTFRPGREFAYPLDAMAPVPFAAGTKVAGIVELLALSDDELLSLERTYIEEVGRGRGINRISVYRLSVAEASDISTIESLRSGSSITPVRKTLLLDLSTLKGLTPELNTLDNFEGLAFGPPLSDGSRSLLVVSDDNFNRTQRTWFLLLRIAGR